MEINAISVLSSARKRELALSRKIHIQRHSPAGSSYLHYDSIIASIHSAVQAFETIFPWPFTRNRPAEARVGVTYAFDAGASIVR